MKLTHRIWLVALFTLMAVAFVSMFREGLEAQTTQHGIQFAFTESDASATAFNLYCATTAGGEVIPGTPTVAGFTANPFLWTSGTPGTTYFCKVTALNSFGESGPSNEASATFPSAPKAPAGLTAVQK